MTEKKETKIKLVQFKVSAKMHREIEKMRKDTGCLTISEVVSDALKFYKYVVYARKKDYSVFVVPNNEKEKSFEIVIPS